MFTTKTVALALAAASSLQVLAAPISDSSYNGAAELVTRDDSDSLFSSTWDIDLCYWQSGMLFVGWSVLMKEFDGKSPEDMYSAVKSALKGNSACNSYTLFEQLNSGIGAKNTTGAVTFHTTDFCTASTMSGILQKVTGQSDFHCSDKYPTEVDPDTSNLIVETMGSDGTDDPSIEKRAITASSLKSAGGARNNGTSTATASASKATASAATSGAASAQASGSSSGTAHPAGLAKLTEATTTDEGLKVPSLKDMAALLHVENADNMTRAEVIDKLNVPGALDN